MNNSDNTRLDSTILNAPNGQNTIPPVPQGTPVPPPIPSQEETNFGTSSFSTAPMGEQPMNFDSNPYPTSETMNMTGTSDTNEKTRKHNAAAAIAAGIGGAALGAGAVLLTGFSKPQPNPETAEPTPETPAEPETLADQLTDGEISIAHNVNDDMTFAEAFAAARAEVGPGGAFSWHGQVYSTYTESEWNALSPQEQHAFNDHFTFNNDNGTHTTQQHTADQSQHTADHGADNTHHTASQTHTVTPEKPTSSEYPYTVSINGEEIEVLNIEQVNGQTVATVSIDGKLAFMVDADSDGTFDYLTADLNNDGTLDPETEVMDLHAANMEINIAQLQHTEQPAPDQQPQALVVHNEDTGQNIAVMHTDDGEIMYLIDDDNDLTFDYAWVDINGNGTPDADEVMNLKEAGKTITVSDLGGFTSEEELAKLQQGADAEVVVAEETVTDDDISTDGDMEIVDPDDDTMPPVTDDGTADPTIITDDSMTDMEADHMAMDDAADDIPDM